MSYAEKWVLVSSTKGIPVKIYSNKPLDEEKDLDADAQASLCDYLIDNNLEPSMVIHRGHSYYLPSTLEQLDNSAKLVLLGSCGAYQHLNKVLSICPTAQIISSRQTGSGYINAPMINIILDQLRQGKDLNWPSCGNISAAKFHMQIISTIMFLRIKTWVPCSSWLTANQQMNQED
jgi:hypothetical protein